MDFEFNFSSEGFWGQFRQLQECYVRGQYCDLDIQCGGQFGTISCHRFILASISKWLQVYLQSSSFRDNIVIILPSSCKYEHLRMFVDTLYQGLAKNKSVTFPSECLEIAACFNIDDVNGSSSIPPGTENQVLQSVEEDCVNPDGDIDYNMDAEWEDHDFQDEGETLDEESSHVDTNEVEEYHNSEPKSPEIIRPAIVKMTERDIASKEQHDQVQNIDLVLITMKAIVYATRQIPKTYQNRKVSESGTVRIGKCQIFKKLETFRIG